LKPSQRARTYLSASRAVMRWCLKITMIMTRSHWLE